MSEADTAQVHVLPSGITTRSPALSCSGDFPPRASCGVSVTSPACVRERDGCQCFHKIECQCGPAAKHLRRGGRDSWRSAHLQNNARHSRG